MKNIREQLWEQYWLSLIRKQIKKSYAERFPEDSQGLQEKDLRHLAEIVLDAKKRGDINLYEHNLDKLVVGSTVSMAALKHEPHSAPE